MTPNAAHQEWSIYFLVDNPVGAAAGDVWPPAEAVGTIYTDNQGDNYQLVHPDGQMCSEGTWYYPSTAPDPSLFGECADATCTINQCAEAVRAGAGQQISSNGATCPGKYFLYEPQSNRCGCAATTECTDVTPNAAHQEWSIYLNLNMPAGIGGSGLTAHSCTCTGGTAAVAADGSCDIDGAEDCTDCDVGYTLNGQVCDAHSCTCTGGTAATAADGSCDVDAAEDCAACDPGYTPNGQVCDANTCTCTGGTAAVAADGSCDVHGAEDCTDCDAGYTLNGQVCDGSSGGSSTGPACAAPIGGASTCAAYSTWGSVYPPTDPVGTTYTDGQGNVYQLWHPDGQMCSEGTWYYPSTAPDPSLFGECADATCTINQCAEAVRAGAGQ